MCIAVKKEPNKFFDIKIDAKSALPVYEQVKRAIKLTILSGHLNTGDQLTSIRELSQKLKINPNTILKVYYQLEVEGFIVSRPGAGYFVKVDYRKTQKEKREIFEELTSEMPFKHSGWATLQKKCSMKSAKFVENNFLQ